MLFAILWFMFWKTQARYEPGKLVGAFIFFYGMFRFVIEFVREPDAQLVGFANSTGLHMGQWLSLPMILGGLSDVDGQEAPRARRADRRLGERGLTPLERALRERIRAEGPISVEAYMEACNSYYYATRDPLGRGRRLHHGARNLTRCSASWSGRRWPTSGLARECPPTPFMSNWARAGARWPTMRCGCCGARLRREVHLVETSPALRKCRQDYCPRPLELEGAGTSPARRRPAAIAVGTCPRAWKPARSARGWWCRLGRLRPWRSSRRHRTMPRMLFFGRGEAGEGRQARSRAAREFCALSGASSTSTAVPAKRERTTPPDMTCFEPSADAIFKACLPTL